MAHSQRVAALHQVMSGLGVTGDIRTIPAGWNCPQHNTELVYEATPTMTRWQGILLCPDFDGTCAFDPDGQLEDVEKPEDVVAAEKARAEEQEQANTIVINVTAS